jgi:hypothetical protein
VVVGFLNCKKNDFKTDNKKKKKKKKKKKEES